MDVLMEQAFVNAFVHKNQRDRLLHALASSKLRKHCILHFSHEIEKYIKTDAVHSCTTKHGIQSLLEQIQLISPSSTCYILSPSDTYDGQLMPLRQAVEETFYVGTAVILIIDERTAVIKDEQEDDAPMRYILHNAKA